MRTLLLSPDQLQLIVQKLALQVMENHAAHQPLLLVGLQPRGVELSNRLHLELQRRFPEAAIQYGQLDITFYRDDVRRRSLPMANATRIPFSIENQKVLLVDDVLWTGRTIRAALDALLDFGRPASVELCVLIDRRFSREFPIQPHYTGLVIDSRPTDKVLVRWQGQGGQVHVES